MKINFDKGISKVTALAEANTITTHRLVQSIEYEIEPYDDTVVVNRDWNPPGEQEKFPNELVVDAASELELPPQLVLHALKREQYFSRHEEHRDYPTMRAARN